MLYMHWFEMNARGPLGPWVAHLSPLDLVIQPSIIILYVGIGFIPVKFY